MSEDDKLKIITSVENVKNSFYNTKLTLIIRNEKNYDLILKTHNIKDPPLHSQSKRIPVSDIGTIILKFNRGGSQFDITTKSGHKFKLPFSDSKKSELEKFVKKVKECSKREERNKKIDYAEEREKALDFDAAINIWEELGLIDEAARIRKLKAEMGAVKIARSVVQGDQITKVKDSVLNRSNVGAGGKSKAEQIKEIKELLDSGAIDKDDYEKMKREIIG